MTKYCLYTEYRNIDRTIDMVHKAGFKGATVVSGIGIWEGGQEDCLVITIIASPYKWSDILGLARDIKKAQRQDTILVTSENLTNYQEA